MRTSRMRSFAERARAWLTLTPPGRNGSPQTFDWDGGRLVIAESVHCRDGFHLRETLAVRGDFTCGAGCRFDGPVYVAGNCEVGRNSQMNRIAVDGRLILGPGTTVEQWAFSAGVMELRGGASVAGDAVSDRAIRLSLDAAAGTLYAAEVSTSGNIPELPEPSPAGGYLEVAPPSSSRRPALAMLSGYRDEKLIALGADTWVYDGSLHFRTPLLLTGNLVVRGSFRCHPGSLLEGDVKAGGSLFAGAGSICRGNLTARGELVLDRDCLFQGDLSAGTALRLSGGVRGFRAGSPVEVASGGSLTLEPNVVVRGRLAGAKLVSAALAEPEGGLDLLIAQA